MPLPLLGAVGGALVRGAATSAVRGAATQGVKSAVGKSIKEYAKNKVKDKTKKIAKDKLLKRQSESDGGGGALVKTGRSLPIKVSNISSISLFGEKSDDLKNEEGTKSGLLEELYIIKSTLLNIKDLLNSSFESDKDELNKKRRQLELSKRQQTEARLEDKPEKETETESKPSAPKMGFFDRIKRFLLMTFLGSLANFAFSNLPKIIEFFDGIGKGIDSMWEVIKIGVISLTTNFPKQIKFLAKLTKKLFGGPVKLIGKLILKTGKIAYNLLIKAGKSLLNFVKNPITNIAKRILGSATKQTGKEASKQIVKYTGKEAVKQTAKETGKQTIKSVGNNAGKLASRLKAFSKVFKRVPVVGALIGIGIDLALGEPLDRAVVGAIGASIGAAIGGAIGTGVIPIPIVGTTVGGFVGGAIGDWLAKKLYADLTGRVAKAEKESSTSDQFTAARGGLTEEEFDKKYGVKLSSKGGLTRQTAGSLSDGLTRETGVQKRTFEKVNYQMFPKSPEIKLNEKDKKNSILDEEDTEYLYDISKGFSKGKFIGDILKLGMIIAFGQKVTGQQINSASNNMAHEFYNSVLNATPDTQKSDLTTFTRTFRDWSRKKIQKEVNDINSEVSSNIKNKRESSTTSGGTTGGGSGGGRRGSGPRPDPGKVSGPVPTGTDADFWALAAIASREDVKPQGSADVAQSIYNRAATGAYGGGRSIKKLITAPGQYEPTFRNRGAWLAIKDRATAIRAAGSATNVDSSARAILDPKLQSNARKFVGGRTDFMGESQKKNMRRDKGDITRGSGYNFHGWFYNARLKNAAAVPNFNVKGGKSDDSTVNREDSSPEQVDISDDQSTTTDSDVTPSTDGSTTDGTGPNFDSIEPWMIKGDPASLSVPRGSGSSVGSGGSPNGSSVRVSSAHISPTKYKQSNKIKSISQNTSYDLNSPQVIMIPIPQQQNITLPSQSVPRRGSGGFDSVNSVDIEKTLYSSSLY